jgi:hypothetical protein
MTTAMYIIIAVVALGVLYLVIRLVAGAYLTYRGTRLVTCPETNEPAAVEVNATHAAFTSMARKPDLQLDTCSRWPERQHCGQECLRQIEAAPDACLIQTMLANWYKGKTCVFCGHTFEEIHWADHKPALMDGEGKTWGWHDIRPEQLTQVLLTHAPVCWNCHVAESFRRQHPDIVVDRPWQDKISRNEET